MGDEGATATRQPGSRALERVLAPVLDAVARWNAFAAKNTCPRKKPRCCFLCQLPH